MLETEKNRKARRLKTGAIFLVILLVIAELVALVADAGEAGKPVQPSEAIQRVKEEMRKEAAAENSNAEGKSKLLWNSWYTMTVGEKVPFGYYNDRVEKRDGKYAYQNQLWKMEEGFINEERVVSFGKDDANVSPILFNFLGTYRDSEFSIDGTFKGTKLSVKARRNKQNLPPIETNVPSKAFLSTLFQVWIGKHLPEAKPGKRLPFVTLFEDGLDTRYASINGAMTLEAEDDYAKKTGTKKLSVELAGMKSVWYVLPTGESVRIEKPDQHLVIEKKTEAEARRFLVKRTEDLPKSGR
ncbi:MAG: hypothetical protein JST04_06840 [Bdellovibrionales bacterium]|nr:hypothetical protein [Bdellovibrionales bacterium]